MLPVHKHGASRQLKMIFHSVPIHPRFEGGDEPAHAGNFVAG
jgi:hypothetical protein